MRRQSVSSTSRVYLNPAGATGSSASGISGTQQVGWASFGGASHAGLWSGTAASWVDLHPAGAAGAEGSFAAATTGTQQVGYVIYGGGHHASLWSGTAASFVDLHPAGALSSQAMSASGTQQVGSAYVDGANHASLWSGTAASWEDLSLALPGSWRNTTALGIWSDGSKTYVVGWGFNKVTNQTEALLWSRPLCYADCDKSTGNGVLDIFDFLCFQNTFVAGCSERRAYWVARCARQAVRLMQNKPRHHCRPAELDRLGCPTRSITCKAHIESPADLWRPAGLDHMVCPVR